MSGSNRGGFTVGITVVDQATKQIDAINARLRGMRAPAERLTRSISKLGDTAGITALGSGFRNLARESLQAFENIGRIVGPLGIITGAASLAGLSRMTTEWANVGAQLGFAAQRSGVAVGQLGALQGAARLAGSSAEALTSGMTTLKDEIFNINAGRGTPMTIAAFNQLGITLRDRVTGQLRTAADVLPELADKIAAVKDPTMQATLATLTLGSAGESLLPFLRRGAAGIAEYTKKARDYGAFSEAGAKAAADLREKQVELTLSVEGLRNSLAEKLAPVLGPMLIDLATWIKDNRDIISSDLAGWVGKAVPEIEGFGRGVNTVVQDLGGWKNVIEALIAIQFGSWVLRALTSLNPLILALAGIALTLEKITTFEQNSGPASLPIGSPLWRGISEEEQSNYVNSPRSQAFLHPGNPNPFHWYNPGSWLDRREEGTTPTADVTMTLEKRAFLNTIAGPESKGRYDVRNGWSPRNDTPSTRIADFSQHPVGIAPGGTSTAAGRYQMISSTWDDEQKRLGLPDFTPASQDKAAWDLAASTYRLKTNRDLEADFKAGDRNVDIANVLAPIWPTLPGGSQSHQSRAQFDAAARANLTALSPPAPLGLPQRSLFTQQQRENIEAGLAPSDNRNHALPPQASDSNAPAVNINGGTGTASAGSSETTVRGSANVNIKLDGFPPGTRSVSTTEGELFQGRPPRVEHALTLPAAP